MMLRCLMLVCGYLGLLCIVAFVFMTYVLGMQAHALFDVGLLSAWFSGGALKWLDSKEKTNA